MNQLVIDILNQASFLKQANEKRINYDISQNLQNTFSCIQLTEKLTLSIALAISINEKNLPLQNIFKNYAKSNILSNEDIIDIHSFVSIMNMNNTLYKFKHFIENDIYRQKPSGLKMTSKAKPAIGKKTFEIIALCVSIVNNCQVCTIHHEEKCREMEFTTDEIYAAVQLTSTIKSISMLEF